MFALLSPRLWLALALAGLLAFTHFASYRKGRHDVQTNWDLATAASNEGARRLEQARQRVVDDSARDAAAREAGMRADSDRARRAAGGLRDDLSAVQLYAQESRAAADATIAALSDVFGQCSGALADMASEADRATSEAMTLRQAWPK